MIRYGIGAIEFETGAGCRDIGNPAKSQQRAVGKDDPRPLLDDAAFAVAMLGGLHGTSHIELVSVLLANTSSIFAFRVCALNGLTI